MNSDIEPYSYTQRSQEGSDGTNIQKITYTINRWKVEIKDKLDYINKRPL